MSVLVIHLTDIHLSSESDQFLARADRIVEAALSPTIEISDIHIVVSGDLANWGLPEEFAAAEKFISKLSTSIAQRIGLVPKVIVVAGNHDCNFSGDQSVRDVLVQSVRSNPSTLTPEIAKQVAVVLKDFFDFQLRMTPGLRVTNEWLATFEPGGALDLRYVLLNSAVFSVKKEDPGRLYVPIPDIQPVGKRTIYVMHHPYGWMQPDNARELAQQAPIAGDLFFMGHEHSIWAQRTHDLYEDSSIVYLKGHVLRDPADENNSAFQTIQISEQGFLPRSYRWVDGAYCAWIEKSKSDFVNWPSATAHRKLGITQDGYRELASAGANFSNRRKDIVTLPDIFVWPNLKKITPEKDTGNTTEDGLEVSSEILLNGNELASVVVVKGSEQFGKSALAKSLALHLSRRGEYPILLAASRVSSWRERSLNERIDDAIEFMYGKTSVAEYRRLDRASKILIVDDFDLAQVTKGYFDGLRALRQHFGRIFLMLDSHPGMEVALSEFLSDECFTDATIYEMVPSSYHHRLELIERWLTIGNEDESLDQIKLTAAKLSKVVDETLGRNLIPAVPVFVLIVLQRAELARDLDTVVKSGSQGFLYESLIIQALTSRVKVCDVVASLTYLTALAATLDLHNGDCLSQVEFECFHVDHCRRYALNIPLSQLQAQLSFAEIIDDRNEMVRFKYPFHHYYFHARSLAQIENWVELGPRIDALIGAIHTERNANILLFLAHLERNDKIAAKIIESAVGMFSDFAEADLFAQVEALEKFGVAQIRQILFEGERERQLDDHQRDERDAESATKELTNVAEARLRDRLRDALAMNAAFKTLQVLGQVLRNHAGEIEGAKKSEIAQTCVTLGLRVLGFLFQIVAESGQEMIAFRGAQIKAERPTINSVELTDELERYLPSIVSNITVGTLIKIANAIGAEDLSPTLNAVLSGSQTNQFIRLVTQLEHFSEFPRRDLLDFEEDVLSRAGYLPNSLIRRFIVRRFYLFPAREELKRSVLSRFKIRALPFAFLEQRRIPKR